MKIPVRFVFIILAITLNQIAFGQDELLIRGFLRDFDTKEKLINSDVTVYKNGRLESSVKTGITGMYELHLELGFLYRVKFSRVDYHSKIVEFDLTNIPPEEQEGGYMMDLPGTLFKAQKGFDKKILKEPIGKVYFSSENNSLEYDEAYHTKMKAKIDAEFARLKSIQDKKYNSEISKAEKAMQSKKWKAAKKYYSKALKIKPEESLPKEKIQEIEGILQGQKK
ncbi:MAG: hypothetical protein RL204_1514 [Bacteroidota bacterium]|jgi:hypothetical protein